MGSDPPLRLTSGPAGDTCPTWSPDGSQIAFLRNTKDGSTSIYLVGALGGVERKLLDLVPNRYFDLDWSPDGRYIAFAEKTDLRLPWDNFRSLAVFLLSVDTLRKRQITFPGQTAGDNRFAFSPDGRTLAFMRYDELDGAFLYSIWRVPVGGGEATKIYEDRSWLGHLAWTGEGASLVFSSVREGGSKRYRVAIAGGTPEPMQFAEDVAYFPAMAPGGRRMAYVREYSDADLWRVEVKSSRGSPHSASSGQAPAVWLSTARGEFAPEYSPDGNRVAFFSEGTGRRELWVTNADGSNPAPLTDFNAWSTYAPGWSPDGKELAFASVYGPGKSKGGVFVLDVVTREVPRLTDDAHALPAWSRDAQWIYLAAFRQRATDGIWKVPAQGGKPVLVTPRGNLLAQESFDGRKLYYSKNSGGIWEMPVEGGEEPEVIPGFRGEWRGYWRVAQDGIYYLNGNARPAPAIEFYEFATRRNHRIAVLTGAPTIFGGGLSVSPDRRWIVYSQTSHAAFDIMLVENFR